MIVTCENLTRSFKSKSEEKMALNALSFTVNKGDIYGIIGPNGAGKTTLINIISTMLTPTYYDKLEVNGFDIMKGVSEIKKMIGIVPANSNSLYLKLTARENLEFFGALYKVPKSKIKKRIDETLNLVELLENKNEFVENFSTGMKQRLMIARALLHEPHFLILDEPTSGLDPRSANNVRNLLLKVNSNGISILIATHNMEEAKAICSNLSILSEGRIIVSGSPQKLIDDVGNNVITATINAPIDKVERMLRSIGYNDIRLINSDDGKTSIKVIDNSDNNTMLKRLLDEGIGITNYQKLVTSLEDVFFELLRKRG